MTTKNIETNMLGLVPGPISPEDPALAPVPGPISTEEPAAAPRSVTAVDNYDNLWGEGLGVHERTRS